MSGVGHHGVGVRGDLDRPAATHALGEAGVEILEAFRQPVAGSGPPASQTAHPPVASVQFEDAARAGLGVQHVHVLGDDGTQVATALQIGECVVRDVGYRGVHVPPPEVIAGPVVATELRRRQEHLEGHRRTSRCAGGAVVGDTGFGGDPGPGQRDEAPPGEQTACIVQTLLEVIVECCRCRGLPTDL